MIAPFPLNAALFIPNLSQPLGEVIYIRSARERHNCLDVGDTVETIEGTREHFRRLGGSNQRIWLVVMSKEAARENLNSATGRIDILRFR